MAQTYTFADALAAVRPMLPAKIIDGLAATLLDEANSMIWNAYDWKESIQTFQPFYLIGGQQDYSAPLVKIPSDLMGLRKVNLVQLANNTTQYYIMEPPLGVQAHLERTYIEGIPDSISYEKSIQGFRLFNRPAASMSAPYWIVQGSYKRKPTKVNMSDIQSTVIPYDDMYFNVFREVLLYKALVALRDKNAGDIQVMPGRSPAANGQLALALAAIERMADNEGLNDGMRFVHPSQGLAL